MAKKIGKTNVGKRGIGSGKDSHKTSPKNPGSMGPGYTKTQGTGKGGGKQKKTY